MKLNAIELRDEHNGSRIKAEIMLTLTNAAVLSYYWDTNESDVVEIIGEVRWSHVQNSMGRAVRTVGIAVEYINGVKSPDWTTHIIVCNMGSHITVDVTDPMDIEYEDGSESTMADELAAMFDMPDPDSDTGIVCGMVGCVKAATRVGLDSDGETKIPVCEIDSHNNRWWGTWPIENDSQFGEAVSKPEPDSVPVGTNKATPDWTRRIESTIVWAERMVRNGTRGATYLDAVMNEISRLNRVKRARLVVAMQQDIRTKIMARELSNAEIDAGLDAIDRVAYGVSLAKV